MVQDHVVHRKKVLATAGCKEVRRQGKVVCIRPQYSNTFAHALPSGGKITCRGGTQTHHRFWEHARPVLSSRSGRVCTLTIRTRLRSAQWTYWLRTSDLWLKTGEMLKYLAEQ